MKKKFVCAVFSHETNTFSPVPTPFEAFGRFTGGTGPVSGEAAVKAYRGTNSPVAAYMDIAAEEGADMVFAVAAQAVPSGPAKDDIVDHVSAAVCAAVAEGCDALFLDLHGGMVTEGYDDPEGELLRRVRAEAPDLPIAVAFDFHSNLSAATIDNASVITGYRTYPHIDTYETGDRAGRTLIRMLNGEVDFMLKCVAPDLSTFQSFLTDSLLKHPTVASVKTSLVIRGAKDEPGVPFDILEERLSRSA